MLRLPHPKILPNTIIAALNTHHHTTKQNYHHAVRQSSLHYETQSSLHYETTITTLLITNITTLQNILTTLWNSHHYMTSQNTIITTLLITKICTILNTVIATLLITNITVLRKSNRYTVTYDHHGKQSSLEFETVIYSAFRRYRWTHDFSFVRLSTHGILYRVDSIFIYGEGRSAT
jgi:hypothetical protein